MEYIVHALKDEQHTFDSDIQIQVGDYTCSENLDILLKQIR